ncbi:MAG: hypothetical protein JWQ76_2644 [Ramlibacter sp.]|nr:hypothetical protein [Ramlibacter sp.]
MPAYRPDIDGLRALAVLLVVIYHGFPHALGAGFVGVDVFFVISGFLISSIIFRELDGGRLSIANFYARRVNRIFPALLLVMACCLAAAFLLDDPGLRRQLGKHVAGGAGFVQNFVLLSEAGYFDGEAQAKPLLHLWSLAIEEQFYLFWPALFATAVAAGARRRGLVLLAVFCVSFALNLWLSAVRPSLTYYLPLTRFWELAMGGALAGSATAPTQPRLPAAVARFAAPLGLVLLAAALVVTDSQRAFPDWVGLLPTIGTALVIAAGPAVWVNRRVLAARPLVALGLVSYPLYLWHWPLLSFLHLRMGQQRPGALVTAAVLLLSLLLAWLTYRVIEQPLKRMSSVRKRAIGLTAAMAVLLAAGLATWLLPSDGAVAEDQTRLETYRKEWQFNAACLDRYRELFVPRLEDDRDFCAASHPGAARTVFVLGDSHANRLYVGLQQADPATDYVNLARGNCLPFLGLEGTLDDRKRLACQPTSDALVRTALASPAEAVVVTAFFARPFNGQFLPASPDVDASMAATMRALGTSGKRVVVMLDVPTLPFHPRACLPTRASDGTLSFPTCRIPRARHEHDLALYAPRLRTLAAAYPNIRIFDPTPLLCDADYCYGARNQWLLYWDPNHLNSRAAAMVARELAKQLDHAR